MSPGAGDGLRSGREPSGFTLRPSCSWDGRGSQPTSNGAWQPLPPCRGAQQPSTILLRRARRVLPRRPQQSGASGAAGRVRRSGVALLGWWCANRFGLFPAAAAAAVVASNPPYADLSREVRGYSLLALCAVAATIAFERLVATPTRRAGTIYVLSLAIGIGTHLYGVLLIPLNAAVILARRELTGAWLARWTMAATVGVLPYVRLAGAMWTNRRQRVASPVSARPGPGAAWIARACDRGGGRAGAAGNSSPLAAEPCSTRGRRRDAADDRRHLANCAATVSLSAVLRLADSRDRISCRDCRSPMAGGRGARSRVASCPRRSTTLATGRNPRCRSGPPGRSCA